MKKTLSLLLSLIMVISAFCGVDFSAFAAPETIGELKAGETAEFYPETNAHTFYYFSFVPEESGTYIINTTDGKYGILCSVYDENMEPVDETLYNQYKGWSMFTSLSLCVDGFEAGKTYYVRAYINTWTSTGAKSKITIERHTHAYSGGLCTECGQQEKTAGSFDLGETVNGKFITYPKQHSYSFTATADGFYTFNSSLVGSFINVTENGNKVSPVNAQKKIYFFFNRHTYDFTVGSTSFDEKNYYFSLVNHEHTMTEKTTPSTCVKEGVITRSCSDNCGYSTNEPIPIDPDAHQFVNGVCKLCGKEDESYVQTVTDITLGESYSAAAQYGGEETCFTFTPEESALYEISSKRSSGTGIATFLMTDGESEVAKYSASYALTKQVKLTAGKTYTFTVTIDKKAQYSFTFAKHTHKFTVSSVTMATCDSAGYLKKTCTCGEFTEEYTEPTGEHNYVVETVKPTCVSNGYTVCRCTFCGADYRYDYVPADPSAHTFVNGICVYCSAAKEDYTFTELTSGVTLNLREDEERILKYVPEKTGYKTIKSTGSADPYATLYNSEMEEINEADDISDSNYNFRLSAYFEQGKTYYLSVGDYDGDGATITLSVKAHAHSYKTEKIEATCGSMGATYKYCECGDYTITDVKEATGNHKYKLEETVAPTCTERGYDLYICSVCYDELQKNYTEPTGVHEYEDKVCVNCGDRIRGTNAVYNAPLPIGEETAVTFTTGDDIALFTFTPDSDGTYVFDTLGYADTFIQLTDENGKVIAEDDDSALGENARLCAELTAGKTYTFSVDVADFENCTFRVKLYKHDHNFVSLTVPPTCSEEGYTEYTCKDCWYSYTGDITSPTGNHSFKDGICTECSALDTEYPFAEITPSKPFTVSAGDNNIYSFSYGHSGNCTIKLSGGICGIILTDKNSKRLIENETPSSTEGEFTVPVTAGEKYYLFPIPLSGSTEVSVSFDAEHDYEVITVPSSCTTHGYTYKKCKGCGAETEKTELPLSEHIYTATVTKPTFAKGGYTTYACKNCGNNYTADLTNPLVLKLKKPKLKKPKAIKKGFRLIWGKIKNSSGYEIQYSTSKKFKKAKKKTVKNGTATKKKIKKLKSGKTYYIRVRAYSVLSGKKTVSKWSKVKKVKVK